MRRVNFLLVIAFLLSSCVSEFLDEFDKIAEPEWNPVLGIPAIYGDFTLEDYLEIGANEVIITQDQEGVVVIEYAGEQIKADRAEDLIDVPAQSFNKALNFNLGETNSLPISGTITKSYDFEQTIETEAGKNDELDSMLLKAGILAIGITGDLPVSGELDLVINSVLIGGQPVTRNYAWTHTPSNPGQSYLENIDLTNAFVDFTKNNTTTNNFNFTVDITIQYEGQAISPVDEIDISIEILNPKFRLVYGKFTEREFATELESVELGILDKVEAEGFYLAEPEINFNFSSSYGIPVEADIIALEATNKDGQVLAFSGAIVDNPIPISAPGLNEIGNYAETLVSINNTNSNITDIIAFLPTSLDYQFEGRVVPSGSPDQQFVMDTSEVLGEYTVRLPLSGRVANFTSTQEFNFEGGDLDFLKDAKVIISSENGLPLTVGVEVVFLDANDNELITLFKGNNLLQSGVTDQSGIVTTPTTNRVEQELTQSQLNDLGNVTRVKLISTLFTGASGTENVKIRMQDQVKVALYLQTTIDI
jgi:hypothetical protein